MSDSSTGPRHTVLDVFGLKLEVSNPRLAELLTMDAGDALGTDVKDLVDGALDRQMFAQAAPDNVLASPSPKSDHIERVRREFRAAVDELGERLGFDVDVDGTWLSPTGVDILTRTVERPLALAAAAHFVAEIASATQSADEHAVLFIVESQQTADVFKVAIRQRRRHHHIRTVALSSLQEVAALRDAGAIDHRSVVLLLAPVANIDVGEVLSVFRAAASEAE
jgi:hypothetical protein